MTSSSSLYGTVTTQNTSSGNSTSLYGEAGTPIPDSSGNVVVRGDLYVLSGNILTTASTGNIFPANATTINLGLAATAVNIGAGSGTTTVNNNLTVGGDLTVDGTFVAPSADFGNIQIAVVDNQTISTSSGELRLRSTSNAIKLPSVTSIYTDNTATFNLLNQPTTVNAFLAATTLNIGADTGETNINNDLLVEGIGTFTGDITAPGADLGAITIAVADDQTITTQSGELRLSSFNGSVKLASITSLYTDTTGTFNLLNQPTTVFAFRNATTLELGEDTGTTGINNDLRIDGTTVSLAPATNILYSESNNRLNRPSVRSTTGNTSGFRVEAPNATTSAASVISAFSSNDSDNGKFINLSARGSTTNDLRIQTGKYTAGVLGPSGTVVTFIDNATAYATVNPAGPTDPLDLTTKSYVDAQIGTIPAYDTNVAPTTGGIDLQLRALDPPSIAIVGTTTFLGGTNITISETSPNVVTIDGTDLNTTYTQDASATTGGANLNLVGSDATTDTIKFAEGTNVTITATDANTITISAPDTNTTYTQNVSATTGGANLNLVGSDATTDTVKFANGTGVTVAETDANTMTVSIGQAVGTSDSVSFADVTLDSMVNLNTATLTTTTTAADQVADSFVAATYRTCKYVIQVTSGSAYQAVEALLVHDGSSAFINTYSDVRTGANLTSINAAVVGANIELQVTPVNAATTYKISKTLIAV